jgi:hypothetical protein
MPSTSIAKPKKKPVASTRRSGAKKAARKKAAADSGKLLPRKIHVVIDGVPVTLHAAKGKRTLTAARLRAAMKKVIESRKKDE